VRFTSFLQPVVMPGAGHERNFPVVYHEQGPLSMFAFPISLMHTISKSNTRGKSTLLVELFTK